MPIAKNSSPFVKAAVLVFSVVILFLGARLLINDPASETNMNNGGSGVIETETLTPTVTTAIYNLSVTDKDGKITNYEFTPNEGQSVHDALKELDTTDDQFAFEVEEYDFGPFITSINGYKAEPSKEFWGFYVNGKQAAEGIGDYDIQEDDQISFKLEAIK